MIQFVCRARREEKVHLPSIIYNNGKLQTRKD
jgi:hypothetical protein